MRHSLYIFSNTSVEVIAAFHHNLMYKRALDQFQQLNLSFIAPILFLEFDGYTRTTISFFTRIMNEIPFMVICRTITYEVAWTIHDRCINPDSCIE